MADLVPDDRPDRAVVHRSVGVGIEERRLQDRCGKHDLVVLRVVVGVDLLRRHLPLGAIDRHVQARDLIIPVPQARAPHVADEVVAAHLQTGVVLPFVRIADLGHERGELLVRLGLRLRRHPVQMVDAVTE